MADQRRHDEWARAGVQAAASAAAFGGQFDPLRFIPPAFRGRPAPAPAKPRAERESESRRAWKVMDRVFGKK